MKRILIALSLMLLVTPAFAANPQPALPGNEDVLKILKERIDTRHQGVGIVVGLIDESGRRVVSYGTFDNDKRAVNGDTLFEIGSETKVFTSLLLADAVARGEVSLDDPVAKFLPAGTKVPERGGKKITLLDLATHTSGLPRLPANLQPADMANPYADYTVAQLYEFLASYELPRDIGSQYEYSNLGAGLLGHALALRAKSDYATLLRTRITDPLKMKSTVIAIDDTLRDRLAPGHDAKGARVANWDLPSLAGAGAIRSSANDLLAFLSANIGLSKSPLNAAMASMLKPRRSTTIPNVSIAMGWHVLTKEGREIFWHNGGTGGYRSFMAFDPKLRTGVVVLSNMFTDSGVDDIGVHLIDASAPLIAAPKTRTAIKLPPEVLERYVGQYQLAPGFVLAVTREGDRLFTQATGQPKVEVFPESATEFFLTVVDAQISFQAADSGKATSLILHQGGRDMPAKRIEGEIPAPKERKEVAVPVEVLDRYVGRYQLAPNFVIAITREGTQLFLQATAQPKFPLFAEGEHDFFLKAVDAQVTFASEGSARATKLTLHQNGQNIPGPRIE